MIEPTELFTLISLFWKNLEAHYFHCFLTDSYTKQSENSENGELPDFQKNSNNSENTSVVSVILSSGVTMYDQKVKGSRVRVGILLLGR